MYYIYVQCSVVHCAVQCCAVCSAVSCTVQFRVFSLIDSSHYLADMSGCQTKAREDHCTLHSTALVDILSISKKYTYNRELKAAITDG